jgi:FkbM family methyltransferase
MIKINKKYLKITIIVIIILLVLNIKFFLIDKFTNNDDHKNNFEENIELAINPYIKTNTITDNHKIIWQKLDSNFMSKNWPNTFDFDYDIKDDIINKALTLPLNSGIIDCGAHIGDGSVSIAHALKHYNREDIIVYAIDPSKYKCEFIEFIKNKNNLNNLIVINYGLSNVNNEYKTLKQSGDNTGAWDWIIHNNTDTEDVNNINKFIKLDDLIKDNIIKHKIGIIHLDVEGMEKEALIGGTETITQHKPYISIENNSKSGKDSNGNEHSLNNNYYLEFLPKEYKYLYNKGQNNIFSL